MASAPLWRAAAKICSIDRYDSVAGVGPMYTASSAAATCGAARSASEYTTILRMAWARHARAIRMAISPRLAINTELKVDGRDLAGRPGKFTLGQIGRASGREAVR